MNIGTIVPGFVSATIETNGRPRWLMQAATFA